MADQSETFALGETGARPSSSSRIDDREVDGETNAYEEHPSHGGSRRLSKQQASVLAACALLQFPIWGFAMCYGVFQEYYTSSWPLQDDGNHSVTGIIGTTFNGVIYMSMPFLFAALTRRWAHYRHTVTLCGALLNCLSFVLSSYSTQVWHVIATQGVLAPLGCALMYSPITLSLGEWYANTYRAVAYGIILSSKNIVGSSCPFFFRYLLDQHGFRATLRIWAALIGSTSVISILIIPGQPARMRAVDNHPRQIPWQFLKHKTFHIYAVATLLQSAGYGIPQTYLGSYAHDAGALSPTLATLLLVLFNIPGIVSSSFFGFLNDSKRFSFSATTTMCISAMPATVSIFLLWGLAPRNSLPLLTLFAIIYGFFTSGYSSTWGGVLNELESEAASKNEAIDTGVIYGLLNGSRGIGYVAGGIAGVLLLQNSVAESSSSNGSGYGTEYSSLIVFTGLASVFGGWSILWQVQKWLH